MRKSILLLSMILIAPVQAKSISGETVYETKCAVCHDEGKMGAPKLEDKHDWKPRIEKGMDKLFTDISDRKHHVPCHKCTQGEVKEALKYMIAKASGRNHSLW